MQALRPEVSASLAAVDRPRDGEGPARALPQRRGADRRPRGRARARGGARRQRDRRGDDRAAHAAEPHAAADPAARARAAGVAGGRRCCWRSPRSSAGIVLLGDRTHRGTGTAGTAGHGGALTAGAAATPTPRTTTTRSATEPSTPTRPRSRSTATRTTVWTTESYTTGDLQKAGVGLALDAAPGAVFRELRVRTPTPGFAAQVYVADAGALPTTVPDAAGSSSRPSRPSLRRQTVDLDTAGQRARWVLLWITRLPPGERPRRDQRAGALSLRAPSSRSIHLNVRCSRSC